MSPELRQECIEVVEALISVIVGEFGYSGWERNAGLGGVYDDVVRADKLLAELKRP
jgi:hypothetical protein